MKFVKATGLANTTHDAPNNDDIFNVGTASSFIIIECNF